MRYTCAIYNRSLPACCQNWSSSTHLNRSTRVRARSFRHRVRTPESEHVVATCMFTFGGAGHIHMLASSKAYVQFQGSRRVPMHNSSWTVTNGYAIGTDALALDRYTTRICTTYGITLVQFRACRSVYSQVCLRAACPVTRWLAINAGERSSGRHRRPRGTHFTASFGPCRQSCGYFIVELEPAQSRK